MVMAAKINFYKLPWDVHSLDVDFVPSRIRFFITSQADIVIAWHKCSLLLLTFLKHDSTADAVYIPHLTSTPISCQAFNTEVDIFDVTASGGNVFLVDVSGRILSLQPFLNNEQHNASGVAEKLLSAYCHVEVKRKFMWVEVYKFSQIRRLSAVISLEAQGSSFYFVAIYKDDDGPLFDLEVYCVLCKTVGSYEFQLQFVQPVPHSAVKVQRGSRSNCCVLSCTKHQAAVLFGEAEGTQMFLLGLPCGQLFSVSLKATKTKTLRSKKQCSFKLLYQSSWGISQLLMPLNGCNLFVVLDGGFLVVISRSSTLIDSEKLTQLCYKTVMLPGPMHTCYAPTVHTVLCSNGVDVWIVKDSGSADEDICVLPVKGILSFDGIEGTSICIGATNHKVFYALDVTKPVNEDHAPVIKDGSHLWAACDLNTPTQYVYEMKEQTCHLSHLRCELEAEDRIISGISASARAHLMTGSFSISVKLYDAEHVAPTWDQGNYALNYGNNYRMAVEIFNKSLEEFSAPLWKVCVSVENPNGEMFSKSIPVNRTFSPDVPFSTVIPISFPEKGSKFPILVSAYLIAELADISETGSNQWLSIPLGEMKLDISYFLNVSTLQPSVVNELPTLEGSIKKVTGAYCEEDTQHQRKFVNQTEETTVIIPIPENFRNVELLFRKALLNCEHRCEPNLLQQLTARPNDIHTIWLSFRGHQAQLLLQKSCASFTIRSDCVELVHSVKSWLSVVLQTTECIYKIADHSLVRCQNLKALLELKQLSTEVNDDNLLSLYHDLRNSVTAYLPA